MKSKVLALVLAALSILTALRSEEIEYQPINPALLYWQAAALLPKLSDEGAKLLQEISSGRKPVQPATVGALFSTAAELLFRKATNS